VMNGARTVLAEQSLQRLQARLLNTKHTRNGSIHPQNRTRTIQGNHASWNVLEHGFHQLPPPLQFLNHLLEAAGKLIDLCAAVAQLRGHGIERAHQQTKLVLHLLRNLIIEVARRNFARSFCKRLNEHSDLLREEQRNPHHSGQKENRKKEKN